MDGLAIDEPELMHAARMRTRAVEEGNPARHFGLGNVEQLDPGGLGALFRRLIGNRHDVAADFERIGAHLTMRQVRLHHELGVPGIADIDAGEVLGRGFMREPQNAPPVLRELQAHALAEPAEAGEFVLGNQLHVQRLGHHKSPRAPLADKRPASPLAMHGEPDPRKGKEDEATAGFYTVVGSSASWCQTKSRRRTIAMPLTTQ